MFMVYVSIVQSCSVKHSAGEFLVLDGTWL